MTDDRGPRERDGLPWQTTDPTVTAAMAGGLLLAAVLGLIGSAAESPAPSADRGRTRRHA